MEVIETVVARVANSNEVAIDGKSATAPGGYVMYVELDVNVLGWAPATDATPIAVAPNDAHPLSAAWSPIEFGRRQVPGDDLTAERAGTTNFVFSDQITKEFLRNTALNQSVAPQSDENGQLGEIGHD